MLLLRGSLPAHVAGFALAKPAVAVGMLRLAETGATFDAGTVTGTAVAKVARGALSWARGVSGLDQLVARFVRVSRVARRWPAHHSFAWLEILVRLTQYVRQ